MSRSYIKDYDINWSEYLNEDDEKLFDLYSQFENSDKVRKQKR